MKTVSIINYGVGNIFSISQALQTTKHCQIRLTNDSDEILNSDYLILPGVGAYGAAMERIREFDLHDAIQDFAKIGKPLLGICLGMQILSELSFEFGNYAGLGLIEGRVEKIENNKFKVPVMTLDKFIENYVECDNIGLKIDVQGSGIDLLNGLDKMKSKITFIIIENDITDRYRDGVNFSKNTVV